MVAPIAVGIAFEFTGDGAGGSSEERGDGANRMSVVEQIGNVDTV